MFSPKTSSLPEQQHNYKIVRNQCSLNNQPKYQGSTSTKYGKTGLGRKITVATADTLPFWLPANEKDTHFLFIIILSHSADNRRSKPSLEGQIG
jgi:hypothetical protein